MWHPLRQRVDVVEVAERDAFAFAAQLVDGILQMSARAAPADNQQVAFGVRKNSRFKRHLLL